MTNHPTPGAPLSADDVGLLKREDVLKWLSDRNHYGTFVRTMDGVAGGICWFSHHFGREHHSPRHLLEFIGRPDADGWIAWSGGDRPVPPATRVRVKFRSGREDEGQAAFGRWWQKGGDAPDDIIAFRLPTDRRAEAEPFGLSVGTEAWPDRADTPPSAGLVEWLRTKADDACVGSTKFLVKVTPDRAREIAAALKAAAKREREWKAEREQILYDLQAEREDNAIVLSRAEAQVAALREALEPFAAMADAGDQRPKDDAVWAGQDGRRITYGDFRRARQALSAIVTPGRE